MSLRINQNILSLKAHSTLAQTSDRLSKSIEKLSSGLRINRAADDAAGLAISEKLRRQTRGLSRAILNAQDGISLLQTAEGAMNESHSILQRMRELALQSGNDTLTSNDRLEIQKEVNQLRDDINRISKNTEFNTKKLLDGSQSALVSASTSSVRGIVFNGAHGAGGEYEVSITLEQAGISEMQRSQIFTMKGIDPTTLAQGNTKLEDIAQFYNTNGEFILENPQQLTINGNSKSEGLYVDGQMTLDQLSAGIQNALVSASGLGVTNSSVGLVTTASSGVAGLGGYIEITSGSVGEPGKMGFAADQGILNALGMAVTRDAKNSQVEVTMKDHYGNTSKTRTNSDRVTGLLEGIDMIYDSQAAQIAGTKGLETGLEIGAAITFSVTADIAGVSTAVTVNIASGNWSMEGIARSVEGQLGGLGSAGMTATIVGGELRITYEPNDPTDSSELKIAGAPSTNELGLLDGNYNGFVTGTKDVDSFVKGFSMYDVTTGATDVTINVNDGYAAAAIAITAYTTITVATTADLKLADDLIRSVSETLEAATVAVQLDYVGNSLVFSSTRIGREHVATAVYETLVEISGTHARFEALFAISDGTAKGSGDKNFQLHVVDNQPQYQIGADQGQTMKISMGNMGAESLGVDNLDMTSIEGANRSLGKISMAIDKVSSERSKLGAFQNRLEYAINNLRNTQGNLTAAESRIRDADIAMEMIEFTRNQIVSQSGTAMLAQANLVPQGVLQLLR